MNIGKALKTCRESRMLSTADLATALGLSVTHLKLVEQGKRELPPQSIEKISKHLGVPIPVFNFLAMDRNEIFSLDRDIYKSVKGLIS
jgi:transcriptional regulator with XRE-family HTH domain